MQKTELIQKAILAKEKAYAPYSNFRVGAALLAKSGKVYIGANIENPSYSLTICAERTAIFSAILEGEREFETIVIASDANELCPPCGACRQVIHDLCGEDVEVVLTTDGSKTASYYMKELLPLAFKEEHL